MRDKRLTKKDVVQAVLIASREAVKRQDVPPLFAEALNAAVVVLKTTNWRMPHKSKRILRDR